MNRAERGRQRAEGLRQRMDRRRRVLLRDFLIFELKLFLDGLKGLLISQAALVAVAIDFLRPGGQDRRLFYKVLNLGERADSWLSLYGVSERAAEDPEGLLGVSREGSNTLLGQLERFVHRVVVGEHPGDGELYGAASPDSGRSDWSQARPAPAAAPAGAGPGAAAVAAEEAAPAGRSGFEELRVHPRPAP